MKNDLYNLLTAQSGPIIVESILVSFLAALIMGIMIFVSYRFAFSGAVYSARFNVSLVMLVLVTTLVMLVIGNNIALSLGMVGALSIVRFRTAIKDPRDTAYIFWSIAVGICCGVSEFMVVSIGTSVLFLFILLFGVVKHNERYLIVVRGNKASSTAIVSCLQKFFGNDARMRVQNSTDNSVEFIYELSEKTLLHAEKKNKKQIVEVLLRLNGVNAVNLLCQNDEINR